LLNALSPQELAEGIILLFDGETTFGWQIEGEATVENGILKLGGTKPTKARPTMRFAGCKVKVDTSWTGGSPPSFKTGLGTMTLTDSTRDGQFFTQKLGGGVSSMSHEKDGTRVERYSTSHQVDTTAPAGSQLWLRNVKLSFNEAEPIKAWLTPAGGKAQLADVGDGWKVFKGGLGGIRSRQEFAHFVLQLEGKLSGAKAHAEVVVRAPPDKVDEGIAVTLQAGSNDKLDLGSLVGKQKARKSLARVGEPFHLTVAVCENDLAVWVNGVQVTDWSAGPPAKGRSFPRAPVLVRLPDPGTELSIRNARYVKLIGDRIPPGMPDDDD
jgi:hypothetical protein